MVDCTNETPCCIAGRGAFYMETFCLCDCHYPKTTARELIKAMAHTRHMPERYDDEAT